MVIQQGDLFWQDSNDENGGRRPFVVIQNDFYNDRSLRTTIVCAITTSLHRANDSSNVLLEVGEGGLPRQSVVVTSQVFTVDKNDLHDYIGKLSPFRVRQILRGINELLQTKDVDEKEERIN